MPETRLSTRTARPGKRSLAPAWVVAAALLAPAPTMPPPCETPECPGVLYVWTPRMPLSEAARPNAEWAAGEVGADLTLVAFEELERFAESGVVGQLPAPELAEAMLAAGALAHAPSLVVHENGRVLGPAILGYKSAEAYESIIAARLSDGPPTGAPAPEGLALPDVRGPDLAFTDYDAVGVPGAYFRWVPGRQALAYESRRSIYLLDMEDGESRLAPGYVDFIPTPDGRYFVTPLERNAGLGFFDANEVFEAAQAGRGRSVRPVYVDERMRDQYPSIGILAQDDSTVRYRVLTSWFDGLRYRDYELRQGSGAAQPTIRAIDAPVVPCPGMRLSTPIMSQDGLEVAARDEASGTTKIYRFQDGGRCEEVIGLGMPTRKVAWHPSGRLLAFSTPRVRTAASGGVEPGIFVYDRVERRVTRVADSESASQLAFPDFVGDDAIAFMIPGGNYSEPSHFRVVEPLP